MPFHKTETVSAVLTALDDIPDLCDDLERLRDHVASIRLHHANLKAAVLASLNAHHEGEDDPFWYVRDELANQGDAPPPLRYPRPYTDAPTRGEGR
ncbi:hypothetical protein GCM10010156_61160 [Planobispora rosea]|uniref:Uncharacterized protein n=1 Tax=Planobispora rosea TaxID=35762 RepID=A0A8J3S7I9_PLARO|nr:hypothetical protein [Planobispora rosea]GGS94692.1 hypothetical protein GCM10010156_61160 [Planobispora rosea]GIH87417.1 hypothetical protein Pro02_58250 [Planobispora rosea]